MKAENDTFMTEADDAEVMDSMAFNDNNEPNTMAAALGATDMTGDAIAGISIDDTDDPVVRTLELQEENKDGNSNQYTEAMWKCMGCDEINSYTEDHLLSIKLNLDLPYLIRCNSCHNRVSDDKREHMPPGAEV